MDEELITDRLTEVYRMVELDEDLTKKNKKNKNDLFQFGYREQIASHTLEIEAFDPVVIFEKMKKFNKNRIFWSDPTEDFYIVGMGEAVEISRDKSRFETTKEQWSYYVENAFISNKYKEPGTGLFALGGFSFDPKKESTELWDEYDQSQFTIPEYSCTKVNGKYYFTSTLIATDFETAFEQDTRRWDTQEQLLTDSVEVPSQAKVQSKDDVNPEQWLASVKQAIKELKTKESNKIVLARELRLKLDKKVEIAPYLKSLLDMQTNSFVFAFEKGEDCFIGASPERLVKVSGNRMLSTCLAGTAPRGQTKEDDEKIKQDLFHDQKNRNEHQHVVQFIHDNIKGYCSEVDIPDEPVVYPLKNLHHLYTPVKATLKEDVDIFDIIKQLHPTPALGGTPQEDSLQFIRDNESLDRGWYGAPIGWLDSNQNAEFAVAIRSGLIHDDEISLFAGCGIMKDSDAELEYEETKTKFLTMLSVLEEQDESY